MTAPATGTTAPASTAAATPSSGLDRVRETSKWLIGAFAAIAAVLLAGFQFTSLLGAEPSKWLWLSLGGALLSLLAVTALIRRYADVMLATPVTHKELADQPVDKRLVDDVLFAPANTYMGLSEKYKEAQQSYSTGQRKDGAGNATVLTFRERQLWFEAAEKYRQRLINYRSYLTEQRAFETFTAAGRSLILQVMGVVLGIALFVFGWIQSKQPDALISAPTVASLALTGSSPAALNACAGTDKTLQVVVLKAKSITVGTEKQVHATVVPLMAGCKLSPVEVDTPAVTITLPPKPLVAK
ncbi:hypothetical protein [Deinococcus knuensis]|uniref:DUF4231 domain-containing protein n=1 Tax=Deinococcus knuensis TaxID=1837380 RepID=A0ABQ2SZ46_9DEIO|nr:hypothetical protein [Deinococcus knuensis]GGS44569.1 hypothetical protein GCM10008961_39190 [Deinococcus knuensis]